MYSGVKPNLITGVDISIMEMQNVYYLELINYTKHSWEQNLHIESGVHKFILTTGVDGIFILIAGVNTLILTARVDIFIMFAGVHT